MTPPPMDQNHRPPSDASARHEPILNAPPGASWLCAGLVVTHLIYKLLGLDWQDDILGALAFVPARLVALISESESAAAVLPTLVSHAFLHGGAMHLLLNVGFLLAFGSVVERRFGAAWMLAVFVIGAAGGAIGQTLAVGAEPMPMIGASGAVYALIGAAVPLLAFGRAESRARGMLIFGRR